jgi:site-specific recombinase XerD
MARITASHVTRLLARLRRSWRSPKTVRNVVSTLHSVFDLAVRRGWVPANPCRELDRPEIQPSTDIRFLTQEELRPCSIAGSRTTSWGRSNARSTGWRR